MAKIRLRVPPGGETPLPGEKVYPMAAKALRQSWAAAVEQLEGLAAAAGEFGNSPGHDELMGKIASFIERIEDEHLGPVTRPPAEFRDARGYVTARVTFDASFHIETMAGYALEEATSRTGAWSSAEQFLEDLRVGPGGSSGPRRRSCSCSWPR